MSHRILNLCTVNLPWADEEISVRAVKQLNRHYQLDVNAPLMDACTQGIYPTQYV